MAPAKANKISKAQEYLAAIEQGQFTFTCNMMSNTWFDLLAPRFLTADNEPFVVVEGERFYVSNGYDQFELPTAGHRVTIEHEALNQAKESRVIGYEFKLDMPFDSPQYTVGETEAFSRLKQLEKEITKLQ